MTLEQAYEIVDRMNCEGIEAEVYEDYSGRGMYGQTCVGIVTDNPIWIGYFAARIEFTEDFDHVELPRNQDSMGLKSIFY